MLLTKKSTLTAIVFKAKSYMTCKAPSDLAPACPCSPAFCPFHSISLCSGPTAPESAQLVSGLHRSFSFWPEESSMSTHLPFALASPILCELPLPKRRLASPSTPDWIKAHAFHSHQKSEVLPYYV